MTPTWCAPSTSPLVSGSVVTVTDRDEAWAAVVGATPGRLGLHGVDLAAEVDALTPDGEIRTFPARR